MVGLNFPSVLISVLSDAGSILLPYRVAWYVGSQGELKLKCFHPKPGSTLLNLPGLKNGSFIQLLINAN